MKLSLTTLLFALAGFGAIANTLPPLITTISEELSTRITDFGLVFFLNYLFFAVAAFSGNTLKKILHYSNKRLIVLGLLGSAFLFVVAMWIDRFFLFYVWIVPVGYCSGLIETYSSVELTRYESNHSSKILNLSQLFYCIGAVLAPQVAALLLFNSLPWRFGFLILAVTITAIAAFIMVFNTANGIEATPEEPASMTLPKPPAENEVNPFLSVKFLVFALFMFLYVVAEISTASWLAVFFESEFGITPQSAALRISLFWSGVLGGRALMLLIPARYTMRTALVVGSLIMLISFSAIFAGPSCLVASVFVLVLGIGSGPLWPTTVMISQRASGSEQFTAGVIGAGGVGAAIGPYLSALFIRYLGIQYLFLIFAVIAALLLALSTVLEHEFFMRNNLVK